MWELTFENKHEALLRLFPESNGVMTSAWNRRLKKVLCSAEHLVRKADGGSNQDENIAAACVDCNNRRGEVPVEEYLEIVRMKMELCNEPIAD